MGFNDEEKKFVKLANYLSHGDFTLIFNAFDDLPFLKYNENLSDLIEEDDYILMIKGLTGCLGCKNTSTNKLQV
jgi:hypothetical protein